MKRLLVLIALGACACERQPEESAAVRAVTAPTDVTTSQGPTSKPPAVVPMPEDQAALDRMILAGYTPHGSHLHPPGVKECPLAQGSEVVM